jgi:hypothetical protein
MPTELNSLHGLAIADKIARLSAFIGEDLETRCAHGFHVTGGCYLLIAKSTESPVAQVMRGHAARLATMGIRVRAIFSEVDAAQPVQGIAPFSVPGDCRLARDPRLLAAHEQLVLSPTRTWIGDCMRRDQNKRDALERFAPDCAQTGAHAMRSFEAMWRASVPLNALPPIAAIAQISEMAGVSPTAGPNGLPRHQ